MLTSSTLFGFAFLVFAVATAHAGAVPPLAYRVSDLKIAAKPEIAGHISVQTVQIKSGAGMTAQSVARANQALRMAAARFQRDALRCAAVENSGPWEFDLRFEKIVYSRRHVSLVFESFAVCAASPILAKDAVVIERSTGSAASASVLFRSVLPRLPSKSTRAGARVQLTSDTADKLVAENEEALNGPARGCEFFLRGAVFSIWAKDDGLVLYPEFVQPSSNCQIEYRLGAQ